MSNKKPKPEIDEKGTRLMTEKFVSALCEYNGGYSSPEYNFTCYLHFFAFRKIENLDKFVNLRVLYLENNSIEKIEGLDKLIHLESLYLQNNYIIDIEGLDNNKEIVNLNLSANKIKTVKNLAMLEKLENLYLNKNCISSPADIEDITTYKSLSLLDIQNNQIEENAEGIINVLSRIKNLKVLYFKGNEIIRKIPNYRKKMIVQLEQLTYLDERPVKPEDRIGAVAFAKGGFASETEARREYFKKNNKIQEIRDTEKEMMKIPFEERKKQALDSLYNECDMRREKLENQLRVIKEMYENKPEKWEDLELMKISIEYQLKENELYRESEEKLITLTIGKRENIDSNINVFVYEKWMDEVIEVEVIENFFNFENALKKIHKIFEEKKVTNYMLFNLIDLRSKWTELEIKKYEQDNSIHFFNLRKEDVFTNEELIAMKEKSIAKKENQTTKIEVKHSEQSKNEQISTNSITDLDGLD